MKIIFLPKYARIGASSRLRTYQYLDAVRAAGHELRIYPLFGDNYLAARYKGGVRYLQLISAYFARLLRLFSLGAYDLVVIEKELFPYFPAFFESLLGWAGMRYIVDYDDAIFHNYDRSKYGIVRFLLGNKIAIVMKNATLVIAGNAYLAQKAMAAGAKRVELLPTVIDVERYGIKQPSEPTARFTIGWIGTPFTFKYVKTLTEVFKQLSAHYPITLHLIGAPQGLGLLNEKVIPWSEETEVAEIQEFDIGIMPLDDSPWEQGKCAYKLIQYMGCGIPVVASPIGMNTSVVREGENGFLAVSEQEWYSALEKLILDAALRRKMGAAGYSSVQEHYSLAKAAERYISFLER